MVTAHAFRLHLKNYMHQQQKPRKGAAPVQAVDKPTKGTVWVAKSYPPWQSAVLTSLKKLHQVTLLYADIANFLLLLAWDNKKIMNNDLSHPNFNL